MTTKPYRYWVRSADGRAIFGFDRLEAATTAALEMPLGAFLVDTMAQAYFPILQELNETANGMRELVFLPHGGWGAGRFGLDLDLIEAIKKGHVAIVHAFIAKGANVGARDPRGGTALHWAAARGNADVVALLLRQGADRGETDATGKSPLDVARSKQHAAIVALLEQA